MLASRSLFKWSQQTNQLVIELQCLVVNPLCVLLWRSKQLLHRKFVCAQPALLCSTPLLLFSPLIRTGQMMKKINWKRLNFTTVEALTLFLLQVMSMMSEPGMESNLGGDEHLFFNRIYPKCEIKSLFLHFVSFCPLFFVYDCCECIVCAVAITWFGLEEKLYQRFIVALFKISPCY